MTSADIFTKHVRGQRRSRFANIAFDKKVSYPGTNYSKLTMLLVKVSLKLWSLNMAYMQIYLLKKMWEAFAFAKATHIFFSKSICELDILLTRTINILTTNQLVKLTILWTTWPWWIFFLFLQENMYCRYSLETPWVRCF